MAYRKPSMTNLPPEIGVKIFKEILSSPVPDRAKMDAECRRLVQENLKVRLQEVAEENAAE